ncbi:MAG: HU family DNA-binding protein [Minisyncoccales bacterium]
MPEKIGKKELIESISQKNELPKAQAGRVLETLVEEIKSALKSGKKVNLMGLGILRVAERKARMGRNPKTGETIQIPAKKAVKFRASKELKQAVL